MAVNIPGQAADKSISGIIQGITVKPFLSERFLLQTSTAEKLYFDFAADLPIYDYHCHLPVEEISKNRKFENLTQLWLEGDHYKWRAMRANGIDEKFITGSASDEDKFRNWAKTVPMTVRNPLYHWTHLELARVFGISDKLLNSDTADEIYETCNELLRTDDYSSQGIINKMKVDVICTTDDPLDNLQFHRQLKEDSLFSTGVFPAFRPDKFMKVDDLLLFNSRVDQLREIDGTDLADFESFLAALENRVDFFHQAGCRLSDHGIDEFIFEEASLAEVRSIYHKSRQNQELESLEIAKFKSAVLVELCRLYASKGWTQQFHIGPIRNANTRMFHSLGPDTGYDSMGDHAYAVPLARFLNVLNYDNHLAKTILYTVNPRDNEMLAAMTGNFQEGPIPGKIQFGSGWWFNDQKDGIERQIEALSQMGLISRFVGMLTDSRSFMSYPRHEYFRRILCNIFGNDIENGELPHDLPLIGGIIQGICYKNAVSYFQMI